MCVSSYASDRKHKITVRFTGISLIVNMEPASCNTSGMGGFWSGFYTYRIYVNPWL